MCAQMENKEVTVSFSLCIFMVSQYVLFWLLIPKNTIQNVIRIFLQTVINFERIACTAQVGARFGASGPRKCISTMLVSFLILTNSHLETGN
jgi:hypothetical protein